MPAASNERPVSAIPAVQEFERARRELEEFKEINKDFFDVLGKLVDRYNATYDMAEKEVKSKQVSCGSFVLTGKPSVRWDPKSIFEEMGRDFFLSHGGKEVPAVNLELENSGMEAAYVQGLIPDEVVKIARKIKVAHHKPSKVVLP